MEYILFDINPAMIQAWEEFFGDIKNVQILKKDISKISCDALVSPANSFGFMDGGIDYAISLRLGWGLQFKLQEKIRQLLLKPKAIKIYSALQFLDFVQVVVRWTIPFLLKKCLWPSKK